MVNGGHGASLRQPFDMAHRRGEEDVAVPGPPRLRERTQSPQYCFQQMWHLVG
jgi:hypothetical protein